MAEMNLAIVIQAIDNATAAIRGITDVVEGMKRSVESVKDAATTASEGIKGISDTASNVAGAVKSASEGMKQSVEGVKNSANVTAEGIKGIGKAATIAAGAAAYLRERFETAFRAINRAANWVIGTLIAGFYSTIRLGDEYSRFETLFGIPADVAYVWKNTFQELDINFDNFVAGARSVGRGFMQLEQMMPKPKEKKEKQIITPQGLANLKLMAEHYKNLSQYNYYYSQTAKQLAKEVEKELKKLERSLYKVKVQQQKMAEQPFFSPQTLAVLTQMEQKYRQLSAAGYDYISISIEIARMLNQIANETERVAVAQMLFRQGAYEALGIARLPRKKIEQTREAWRQIAPSRETILQADALGDELKRVLAEIQTTVAQIIVENKDLIMSFLNGIREVLKLIREFTQKHPELTKFVTKLAVIGSIIGKVISPFKGLFAGSGVGGFLGRLLSLGRVLSWLVTIFRMVAAAIGVVVGGISLPVLAIIAVVLVLIAIGIWVYKNWDKVKKFLLDTWNKIKEAWNKLVTFLKEKWNAFKEWISGIWEKMKEAGRKIVEGIKKGIEEKWEALKNWFKDKLQKLRNLLPFSEPKDPTSPLRMLRQSGKAIITSVGEGIRQSSALLHETFVRVLRFNIPAMRLPTPIPATPAAGFGGYRVYTFHVVTDRQIDARVEDFMQNRLPQILRMLATGR